MMSPGVPAPLSLLPPFFFGAGGAVLSCYHRPVTEESQKKTLSMTTKNHTFLPLPHPHQDTCPGLPQASLTRALEFLCLLPPLLLPLLAWHPPSASSWAGLPTHSQASRRWRPGRWHADHAHRPVSLWLAWQ